MSAYGSGKGGGSGGDLWKLGLPIALSIGLGFLLAYKFVDPAPPARIRMATGEAEGAYAQFGRRYLEDLAEFGIEVELLTTAGSGESLDLLREGRADVAFVQGGVANVADRERLESLGSLYFEPLWIFHRASLDAARISEFAGLRVSAGHVGSGTRAIAAALFSVNGISKGLRGESGIESVAALRAGALDVVALIASPESELVRELLHAEGIELFSFTRASAYARTHRFLSRLTLPEGMMDFVRNVPDREVELVAPTANLVITKELHPALVDLLVQAAGRIHAEGGVFEAPGAFPSPDFMDLPLNDEAKRYYDHGPPILQRYLPFWLATLLDRVKVMLIPLVALLIPLVRLFPPIYRWRVRSRIYRWYKELRDLDPRDRASFRLDEALREADRIEAEVAEVEAPASYAQELYDLRLHLDFVQKRLRERAAERASSPDPGV